MTIPNSPDLRQVGEVIQAMVKEAGFELKLNAMEFASSLQAATRGDFETYLVGWSGRVDPDGNTWTFMHSRGGQNDGKYANPEVDRLLDAARRGDRHRCRAARSTPRSGRSPCGRTAAGSTCGTGENIVAHTSRLQRLRAGGRTG